MKCKRCGREMKRQKTDNRRFIYICPVCHTIVKGTNDQTPETEYKDAFNILMGKSE